MIGNRYTRLVVVAKATQKASWLCKCDCGIEKVVRKQALETGHVKSCGCLKRDSLEVGRRKSGINNANYRGTANVPHSIMYRFKKGAEQRGYCWDITIEDLEELWLLQEGKCKLTNEPISLFGTSSVCTGSLDRIDSSKGYTKDNIQFVHKIVNIMKGSLPDSEFIYWCAKVASNQ